MELIEVKPLVPFVGSYICALADCDTLDDGIKENPDGTIVKIKVPRKRFAGMISVERAARPHEIEAHIAGTLPERFERLGDWSKPREGLALIAHPEQRTVHVPADVAADLIKRGLATPAGGIGGIMAKLPRIGGKAKSLGD